MLVCLERTSSFQTNAFRNWGVYPPRGAYALMQGALIWPLRAHPSHARARAGAVGGSGALERGAGAGGRREGDRFSPQVIIACI
jgi:hypothetical protein